MDPELHSPNTTFDSDDEPVVDVMLVTVRDVASDDTTGNHEFAHHVRERMVIEEENERLERLENQLDRLFNSMKFANTRNRKCSGYRLLKNPSNSLEEGPLPFRDYDPLTKLPYTTLCNHTPCDLSAEYEYFICRIVAEGIITANQCYLLRPFPRERVRTPVDNQPLYNQGELPENCSGFQLTTGPRQIESVLDGDFRSIFSGIDWKPHNWTPYSKQCTHDPCVPEAKSLWVLIRLYASELLDDFNPEDSSQMDPLFFIRTYSTHKHFLDTGLITLTHYIRMLSRRVGNNFREAKYMWTPKSICFDYDITAENARVSALEPIQTTGVTQHRAATAVASTSRNARQNMDEFRLKCWFSKNSMGPAMINMKRKPRISTNGQEFYINFIMEHDVPTLMKQLSRFWFQNRLAASEMQEVVDFISDQIDIHYTPPTQQTRTE